VGHRDQIPGGKDQERHYGEVKRLPIPDVLKPFVNDFLKARQEMLASKGIKSAEPLIPAVSCKGVNNYTRQAFGRLKKQVIQEPGSLSNGKTSGRPADNWRSMKEFR
jgi:hypothetical protein